jgi:hypothetical protein
MEPDKKVFIWGKYRVISYDANDVPATLRTYREELADGVCVSSKNGFLDPSFDALREFEGIKIVLLRELMNTPMDALQYLPDLEEVSLDVTKQVLDFAWVPSLKKLSGDWSKDLFRNTEHSNLEVLRLGKYKSIKKDMSDFPGFPALRELQLLQSTIQNLNGISRFARLNRIELAYLSKLEKLSELDLPNLTAFVADKCKFLADHEELGACTNLEELKLHECGTIKSLRFIDQLQKLKTFRFIKTDVADGDLSPLQRLADVYFTEKRNFSNKVKDFHQSRR